ncbi:Hypothetical protein PBC10988_15060 [Planctomycetales bacterium 10988]|nr:Hypothetical protein PBC10988_15060 [Planctomycetales bacterium 10988]
MQSVADTSACMSMRILGVLLCSISTYSWAGQPVNPFGEEQGYDIPALIEALGADSFQMREWASWRLEQAGLEAKDALLVGLNHSDPEVRLRCRRIWEEIRALDFQSRLEAFASDTEGEGDYGLPGWERYQAMVGGDPSDRDLFVRMQRAESDLLQLVEENAQSLGDRADAFVERTKYLQQAARSRSNRSEVTLGAISALVFVGSNPELTIPQSALYPFYNLLYQPCFHSAVNDLTDGPRLRKLLGAWIAQADDWSAGYQNLMLAMRYDLKEGLLTAKTMLKENSQPPSQRQYAILAIGKLGTEEDLSILETLLSDVSVCASYRINNQAISTQIRDVALAVLLHRQDADLKDFGFERVRPSSQTLFSPYTLGFAKSEEREATFKRWQAWNEKNSVQASTTN